MPRLDFYRKEFFFHRAQEQGICRLLMSLLLAVLINFQEKPWACRHPIPEITVGWHFGWAWCRTSRKSLFELFQRQNLPTIQ